MTARGTSGNDSAPLRVAVGSMMHETNTFTALRTGLEDFAPVSGSDIFDHPGWMRSSAGGILKTLIAEGIEVVPTLFGRAMPGGVVEREAYEFMREGVLSRVANARPLDGVCLALHGSMYAEGVDDPEGDLLTALRTMLGPEVSIVCALDMHTTMTEKMIGAADGFTAYRTAPHLDAHETGERAARLLIAALGDQTPLHIEWVRVPMLLAGEQSETDAPPMNGLISLARETEQKPGLLSADYLLGFPWADSPHSGVSAVAVGAKSSKEEVKGSAQALARKFWERRHEFTFTTEAHSPDEAIASALASPEVPVIISDSGDNPGAGASQDVSFMLARLKELGAANVLVAPIVDAEAYLACETAGAGARVVLDLGRTGPDHDSPPLRVEALVTDLKTVHETKSAIIETDGITVIVTERRVSVHEPEFLQELGLNLSNFEIIVVKTGYLHPDYDAIAARKMLALTPGDTCELLSEMEYEQIPRPIYPLDREMGWGI